MIMREQQDESKPILSLNGVHVRVQYNRVTKYKLEINIQLRIDISAAATDRISSSLINVKQYLVI